MTFVLGLTGSIGMGKSATAAMFRSAGVPVHDADATVHALYRGAAAPLIEAAFPGTVTDGVVDRAALSARVLNHQDAMHKLEAIVHPLVRSAEEVFLRDAVSRYVPLVVLDIPLLFEGGGECRCDAVAVVSADEAVQRSRVLARPGMTADRFESILGRQMPDSQKRARAHLVIDTGRGFEPARRQVADVLRAFAARPGRLR
jgi:dephospho-CoA kinase